MPSTLRPTAASLLFVASLHPLAAAQDDPGSRACFDAERRAAIEQVLPRLMLETDRFAVERAQAGDPGLKVYLMARQTLFVERLWRRLATRDDGSCETALDTIRRDLRMLKSNAQALKHGSAELGIEKVDGAAAQAALAAILDQIAAVEAEVAALAPAD